MENFWSKVGVADAGCWLWLAAQNEYGYGVVWHNGKPVRAHRLSYELEYGKIPDGKCVLHRCDNPPCVNPGHLFIGTRAENTADMLSKGRQNPRTKLSAGDVVRIRRIYEEGGVSQRELAAMYGVSQAGINYAINKRRV